MKMKKFVLAAFAASLFAASPASAFNVYVVGAGGGTATIYLKSGATKTYNLKPTSKAGNYGASVPYKASDIAKVYFTRKSGTPCTVSVKATWGHAYCR